MLCWYSSTFLCVLYYCARCMYSCLFIVSQRCNCCCYDSYMRPDRYHTVSIYRYNRYNTVSGSEMNVFGSHYNSTVGLQIILQTRTQPQPVIYQAFIFGYRFQVGPHPKRGAEFRIKIVSGSGIRIGFPYPGVASGLVFRASWEATSV